jgi:hypothetical protein
MPTGLAVKAVDRLTIELELIIKAVERMLAVKAVDRLTTGLTSRALYKSMTEYFAVKALRK